MCIRDRAYRAVRASRHLPATSTKHKRSKAINGISGAPAATIIPMKIAKNTMKPRIGHLSWIPLSVTSPQTKPLKALINPFLHDQRRYKPSPSVMPYDAMY